MLRQGARVMISVIHGSSEKKIALGCEGKITEVESWRGSDEEPESYPYRISFDNVELNNELWHFWWDRDELLELK